jgi:hypothetical protein
MIQYQYKETNNEFNFPSAYYLVSFGNDNKLKRNSIRFMSNLLNINPNTCLKVIESCGGKLVNLDIPFFTKEEIGKDYQFMYYYFDNEEAVMKVATMLNLMKAA